MKIIKPKTIILVILIALSTLLTFILVNRKKGNYSQASFNSLRPGMWLTGCEKILEHTGKLDSKYKYAKNQMYHIAYAPWAFQYSDTAYYENYVWNISKHEKIWLTFLDGRLMEKKGPFQIDWKPKKWGAPPPTPWEIKQLSRRYGIGDYHGDGANPYEIDNVRFRMTTLEVMYALNDTPNWVLIDTNTMGQMPFVGDERNAMEYFVTNPEEIDPKFKGETVYLYLIFSPSAKALKPDDPEFQEREFIDEKCRLIRAEFMTMKESVSATKKYYELNGLTYPPLPKGKI